MNEYIEYLINPEVLYHLEEFAHNYIATVEYN